MSVALAYITAKDKEEAEALSQGILEKRLAACTNILPGMRSQYWWEGKIESADEAVLLVKTLENKKDDLLAHVRKHHSYSVPCVVFLKVDGGNPDYLKWLSDEVQTKGIQNG